MTFSSQKSKRAFSLLELLVVIGIICIMGGLVAPSVMLIGSAKFSGNVSEVKSLLELARQTAVAKNTYTWVLFYQISEPQGVQLIAAAIESKDGTDSIAWTQYNGSLPDQTLGFITKISTFPQTRIQNAGTFTSSLIRSLPEPIASPENDLATAVSVAINTPGNGDLTFQKAVRFSPSGMAENGHGIISFVEFGLQEVKGTVPSAQQVAVLRIVGPSGNSVVYQP